MKHIYTHIVELSNTIRDFENIKKSKELNRQQKEALLFNDLNNILLDLYTAWSDNLIISLNRNYPELTVMTDRRKYPDKRIFFTFPLNKIKKKNPRKKDIPAVCVGINASDIIDGRATILIIIENNKETHTLRIKNLDEFQIIAIIESFAKFFKRIFRK